MTETQAIAIFRKNNPGLLVIKLHGGEYQANLPDCLVIARNDVGSAVVQFLEWKMKPVKKTSWRAGQHAMMLKLERLRCSVWYALADPKTGLPEFIPPSMAPVPDWIASGCETEGLEAQAPTDDQLPERRS